MTQARFVVTRSRRQASPSPMPPPAPPRVSHGACGAPSGADPLSDIERPVIVEGVEIEPEAIAREMQNHPAETPAESWREAARALVVRQLLLGEAARRGLRPDAAQAESHGETDEESLIRAVLEEAIELAAPSDLECRRVFEGLKEKFVTPTLFEAAHILIEPVGEGPEAWREAEAEARQIIALVGDDRQAFAEAAAARSACPTAHQGGSLGQIRRGELAPAVQAALEGLAEGATAREPVRSRFGWHAVRLERRIEGRALPYDVVEDKIRDMLEARAWALGAAQYVAELAARSRIEGVELTPPDAGFAACEEGKGC